MRCTSKRNLAYRCRARVCVAAWKQQLAFGNAGYTGVDRWWEREARAPIGPGNDVPATLSPVVTYRARSANKPFCRTDSGCLSSPLLPGVKVSGLRAADSWMPERFACRVEPGCEVRHTKSPPLTYLMRGRMREWQLLAAAFATRCAPPVSSTGRALASRLALATLGRSSRCESTIRQRVSSPRSGSKPLKHFQIGVYDESAFRHSRAGGIPATWVAIWTG